MAGTERTRQHRQARHAGRPHESAHALFARIALKTQRRRATTLPARPGVMLNSADRIAQDWRPIIQRPALDPKAQVAYFERLPARQHALDLTAVDDPFTPGEVLVAINACPRGKACGPDGLGNDWYREHAELLAPLLASLFTSWYKNGTLPVSFAEALIFCVPKKSCPQTGLDFRPIALLNTDYKVYSRVLLNRIRLQVPRLVANTQDGFVPGRQVHDAVDIWFALQARAASGAIPSGAMAVLLDFAKAYDSLDRRFLTLALRRCGFPDRLVHAVEAMHLGTTAAFLADGYVSATEDVNTGIRQGCPLAPTLFILAVDVLYDVVRADADLPGVALSADVRVSLVGFADDTTAYLNSPAEACRLKCHLDLFASISGLQINVTKSIVICLAAVGCTVTHARMGFALAALHQFVRYLGIQIATEVSVGQVWDLVLQQVCARLALAEIKTTDLLQRIRICHAVIIPKLLFVARHLWPTSDIVQRLQRFVTNYAWHGSLTDAPVPGRAWMSSGAATLRWQDGGLQVPNVRDALLVHSAGTVQRWLSATDPVAAATGRVLIGSTLEASHFAPGRGSAPLPRLCRSLAATGWMVLRAAATVPRDEAELELLLPLLRRAGRAPLSQGDWHDGWYRRDYGPIRSELRTLSRLHQVRRGRLNLACLWKTPILEADLLFTDAGRPLRASDLPGIQCTGKAVGDVVHVQWVSEHILQFQLAGQLFPYSAAHCFKRLCDLLVMNYPELLRPLSPATHLSERTQSTDVWSVHHTDDGVRLVRELGPNARHDLGVVTSLRHAEVLARTAAGRPRLQFDPHPALCAVLPLWGSVDRFSRARLRSTVAASRADRAKLEVQRRADAAYDLSPAFGAALDAVDWADIEEVSHSSSRQRLAYHKIKGLRVSGWDRHNERRGCPHCPSAGPAGGSTYHIIWDCPAARQLWRRVRAWWQSLGLWQTDSSAASSDFLTAVFSLLLPRTPAKVWDLAPLSQLSSTSSEAPDGPNPALQVVWQQLVLETFVVILGWRHGYADPDRRWTGPAAVAVHAASCRRVLLTLARRFEDSAAVPVYYAPLVRELSFLFDADSPQPQAAPVTSTAVHLLLFDGGSRGNPGPGGSGACVVRVDPLSGAATMIWSAAVSLAQKTTTNNQAEYQGLITGLRAALRYRWTHLEVIGDSALIIKQMKSYRPPHNRILRNLYLTARKLADLVEVRLWHHHLRAYNRMADSLANHAMDTITSSQVVHPTARPGHEQLLSFLHDDLHPWLADRLGSHVDDASLPSV